MKYSLYIVTGAPGSGKSTILKAFMELQSKYIAFDIDWLAEAASDLADKDIHSDPSTWKSYALLWFEVLHAVYKNGQTPVFFTPNDPQDMEQYGQPAWCRDINWLLLDCDDQTRRQRLLRRPDWTEGRIVEAIADARVLRQAIPCKLTQDYFPQKRLRLGYLIGLGNCTELSTKMAGLCAFSNGFLGSS